MDPLKQKAQELDAKNKDVLKQTADQAKQDENLEKATDKEQKDSPLPKTETVAKMDAANELASGLAQTNLGTFATSAGFTTDDHGRKSHPNDVKFKVKYGAGYKGAKAMEDGSIHVVSSEVAAQFEELGIGSIVK